MLIVLKWQAQELEWKDWGESVLVYHHPSGCTHLLNPTAALALELISKTPATLEEIANQLKSILELDFDTEITANVQAILSQLDELGLIEPVGLPPS